MSELGYDFFVLGEDLVRRPRPPLYMRPLYAERLSNLDTARWRLASTR